MLYNLHDEYDRERFSAKTAFFLQKGTTGDCFVTLTEKRERTLDQNSYLHLLLRCFALEYGETLDFVKKQFYKRRVNPDLYVYQKWDRLEGRNLERLRHSSDLTTEEMSLSIDRFKNFAAVNGILLPEAEDTRQVMHAQRAVERNRQWE